MSPNSSMKRFVSSARTVLLSIVLAGVCIPVLALSPAPDLHFRIDEGRNINSFVREGATAAHLVLRSGRFPRILVTFPAGNSGVGVWFQEVGEAVVWTLGDAPRPIVAADARGRPLHGIEAEATADAAALELRQAVLSSVRVLRHYQSLGTAPVELSTTPTLAGKTLSWARDRFDGAAGYRLSIEALDDATITGNTIRSGRSGRLRLKIRALSGETPLMPLDGSRLLASATDEETRAGRVLAFLSYEEKYLAGSWRFATYF